ncbi:MAG: ABC transporter ATP-binding protein [Cryomorphaceae bacterium]|nr:ABC transporter ATP-binding protein [Cryomorphaceae bacterium]
MRHLFTLNPYFLKYKWHLLGGTLFVTISVLFSVIPPQYVRESFNAVEEAIRVNAEEGTTGVRKETQQLILFYGLIIIGSALLKGVFMFFMRQTLIVMSRHIEYDLKNSVYNHYQKLSQRFFRANSTGDLMNRISEDVSRVRMYLGPALMYGINTSILVIVVVNRMLAINPKLTFYTLVPLPILSYLIYKVSFLINRRSEQVQAQLSTISTFVQETLSGIRVLKANVKEEYLAGKYDEQSDIYFDKNEKLYRVNALFGPLMLLLVGMSTIIIIYIGGLEAIGGNITIGNIAEFIMYVNMLTWPVASIGWVTSIVQRAEASMERLNHFLDEKPDIVNPTEEPLTVLGNIQWKDVHFTYEHTGIKAIRGVSFHVKPGQTLAIIGETGSGKSTIAALQTRLFDPIKGDILVDGKPLGKINLEAYREQISTVPQDVFLFSDTLHNNIAFGVDHATREDVEAAAKLAGLHNNILDFPNGYETRLGERGVTLSGGQKQRTALARALIKKPKILILDDSLSAVDTETEEHILRSIRSFSKKITTFIISHRVSSVTHADHIIVLKNGEIIEQGKHQELMNLKSYYFSIYQKQLEEKASVIEPSE